MPDKYDVIIAGGGAAGYSAGLYSSRMGLHTLLLEQMMPGGQIVNAENIENYLGFPEGIMGAELAGLMQKHASQFGLSEKVLEITSIEPDRPYWSVTTTNGTFQTKVVIIATGSTMRKLGVSGEDELFGSGVSQCATCDGGFFINQVVGIVGGGDSALDEALVLTRFASKILIFCRENEFSGQKVLQERVRSQEKIEFFPNTVVTAIHGDSEVVGVSLTNSITGEASKMGLSGLFVLIGLVPNSDFISELVPLDPGGHIPTDKWMRTAIPGILAAGDVRDHSASQLIASAGDGATSAIAAHQYIQGRDWPIH